ncbi:SGNH/GDSL hydrolase family protein [Spirillospora sp. NPDC047279]|uniref:SGNH/GDSL hydrolase family protein n=1 Tax=Spirillospora sp. NPDC047279 TaxID=3155478 RepID=UPI0033F1F12C
MQIPTPSARLARLSVGVLAATALLAGIVHNSPSFSAGAAVLSSGRAVPPEPGTPWTGAWGTAMQRPVAGDEDSGPNWSAEGFAGHTVRQVVRVSAGGTSVRIRLSNVYGTRPLRVTGATIGRSAGGSLVWPDTIKKVTFGRAANAVVPAGREAVSDTVALTTSPLERLTVTLRFAEATGPATFHRFALDRTYRAEGDRLTDVGNGTFPESTGAWYYLSGVDVAGGTRPGRNTVVTFGDSLVDGVGATPGADARFTDALAERLVAARRPFGVVNAGIGSNKLLNDSACGSDRALARFERDVLGRPGVRSVIVHLGANDLGAPQVEDPCVHPNPKVSAKQIIDGHRKLIRAAHARGVKALGMPILPMKGALFPIWNEEAEGVRQAVNTWIRTSGEYDGVVDAAKVLSDPDDARMPRPGYVFMDGLHTNDAGNHAIAASIDLGDL